MHAVTDPSPKSPCRFERTLISVIRLVHRTSVVVGRARLCMGCCASHDPAAPEPGSTQFAVAADDSWSCEKYRGRALLSTLDCWRKATDEAGAKLPMRPASQAQFSQPAKSGADAEAKTASANAEHMSKHCQQWLKSLPADEQRWLAEERQYQWLTAERQSDLGRGDWSRGAWTLSASSVPEELRAAMDGKDAAVAVLSQPFDMEFVQDVGEKVPENSWPGEELHREELQSTLGRWRGKAADEGGVLPQRDDLLPGARVTLEEMEAWGDPWVVAPALRALAERAKEWHGADCKVGVFIDCPQHSRASEEVEAAVAQPPPHQLVAQQQEPPQSPQLTPTKPQRTYAVPNRGCSNTYVI